MLKTRRSGGYALAAALAVTAAAELAIADDVQTLRDLKSTVSRLLQQREFKQARSAAIRAVNLAEQSKTLGPGDKAHFREMLAGCCFKAGDPDEAARQYEAARFFWKRADDEFVTHRLENLGNLGELYLFLHRLADAKGCYQEIVKVCAGAADNPENQRVTAGAHHALGELHRRWGRYKDAESHLNEAIRIRESIASDSPDLVRTLLTLGALNRVQGRLNEAKSLFERAKSICEASAWSEPAKTLLLAGSHGGLGLVYYDLAHEAKPTDDKDYWNKGKNSYFAAIGLYKRTAKFAPQTVTADHSPYVDCINNLGRLYHSLAAKGAPDHFADAERCYVEAQRRLKTHPERNRSGIVDTLNNLALLEYDRGQYDAAQKYVAVALEAKNNPLVPLEFKYNSHYVAAKIAWAQNNQGQALDHLDEAIAIGVRQRAHGAGGPFDRGRYYTQLMNAAERMVEWQTGLAAEAVGAAKKDHAAAAFRAMELTRALALQDQIALRGQNLFQDMDGPTGLEADLEAAKAKVLQADIKLRNAAQQETRPETEFQSLLQAKRELQEVERQIWNTSPVVARRMAQPVTVATLDQMQTWANRTRTLVLEYLVGAEASYVLAIRPGDDPMLEKVDWEPAKFEAACLRLKDLKGLSKIQADIRTAGQLLARAGSDPEKLRVAQEKDAQAQDQFQEWRDETDELHGWLADFYRNLIPPIVRADLANGRNVGKRIVVLPDGPLVRLPFEALVTGNDGRKREYLLDADLPIIYSPSGTMLAGTDERPAAAPVRRGTDVCFVGKSSFADHLGNWAYNNGDFGGLPRLPRAGEAGPTTFPGILGLAGLNVDIRNQDGVTTEKQVAETIEQTPIVLFSTHGLGGGETTSSFGALVLTRPQAVKALDDDGMFTYEEICECDLRGCELAIHTACDTNVGPNQRGEAAWAVSRGFLVAGSCRVLATQWNAEDSASGEFSAELARRLVAQLEAQQNPDLGQLDYARAVHEAKLDLRRHAIYGETPVLWAPWVLIGSK